MAWQAEKIKTPNDIYQGKEVKASLKEKYRDWSLFLFKF